MLVEHAAEVADAVGDADQVDRHLDGDLLVGADLVEVEVDDRAGAERVALDLADQRLDRRAAVDGDVDDACWSARPTRSRVSADGVDRRATPAAGRGRR